MMCEEVIACFDELTIGGPKKLFPSTTRRIKTLTLKISGVD